jgi:hypothetical protein
MTKIVLELGKKVEKDTEKFKRKNQCLSFYLPIIEEERNSCWKQKSTFRKKIHLIFLKIRTKQ